MYVKPVQVQYLGDEPLPYEPHNGKGYSKFVPTGHDLKVNNLEFMLSFANACKSPREISVVSFMINQLDKRNMATLNVKHIQERTGMNRDAQTKLFKRLRFEGIAVEVESNRKTERKFFVNPEMVLRHKVFNMDLYYQAIDTFNGILNLK